METGKKLGLKLKSTVKGIQCIYKVLYHKCSTKTGHLLLLLWIGMFDLHVNFLLERVRALGSLARKRSYVLFIYLLCSIY